MNRTTTTDGGLVATVDVRVDDWRALGAHLATAADDEDQVQFLLGFMEALDPRQGAYIAARIAHLPAVVQDDLTDTLRSLIP